MDDPELLERLRGLGDTIVHGVVAEIPGWVVRSVDHLVGAWGRLTDEQNTAVRREAERLGSVVADRVGRELVELFDTDPRDQRSTPLKIVRSSYREPTGLLRAYGMPPVERDPFDERVSPDDWYDLSPRAMADLGDPELGPLLLAWGLTKSKLLRGRASPAT